MLAAVLILAAQSADPKVTLTFGPERLAVALDRLSKVSGARLVGSRTLAAEVVVGHLRAVPLSIAMRRLAESVQGKWVPQADGSLVLTQDLTAVRRTKAQFRAFDQATLRGTLTYLRGRLAGQPSAFGTREAQEYRKRHAAEAAARKRATDAGDLSRAWIASSADEETPAWRALARAFPALGEALLLEMPNDAREVWAERPTPSQRPIPISILPILAQYRKELQVLQPDAVVDRVRIEVKRWEIGARYSATLTALGPDRQAVDSASVRLANDSEIMKRPGGHAKPIPIPIAGETALELSEAAREHRLILSSEATLQGDERAHLFEKWLPILTDPVRFEPLTWLPGEGIVSAAKALGMNLIGAVPDTLDLRYGKIRAKETPSQFLARHPMVRVESGWFSLVPEEPVTRLSREQARALLKDAVSRGGISVDAAAEWASQVTDRYPFINWVGDSLATMFTARGPWSSLATVGDEPALRLWSALGKGVQSRLRKGETLRLGELTVASRELIRRLVYWENRLGQEEPTELLPNGIAYGEISMTVEETPIFTSWQSADGERARAMPLSAEAFGTSLAKGSTYWQLSAEEYRRRDRFRLGLNRKYRVTVAFPEINRIMEIQLSESFFDPAREPVDRLPASLAATAEAARQKASAKPSDSIRQTVPPPQ